MPIVKKKNGELVEEYRGVTLMPTFYKVYVSVLADRLKEIEGVRLLSENHLGCRKGRRTMHAMYIINSLMNRQVHRRKGTIVALFVDLKEAFDSVRREIVIKATRGRG